MKGRTSFIAKRSFVLAVLVLLSSAASAQTFDAVKKQVRTFTLPNGMKFIVLERHDAPIAAFHVHADVGSANESYGITGISHILEHMAAKGTKTVGTKDYAAESKALEAVDAAHAEMRQEETKVAPDQATLARLRAKFKEFEAKTKEFVVNNEYWDMMKREGDAGFNAGTSPDHTIYTSYLPSNKLEFWMAMTSDRFLNPVFREFYKERDVIQEERRLIVETQPMGKLQEDFLAVAFKAHPYHHYVIGHMSDLQSITRQDVEDYFKKFYGPSNLTVGIVGDVKADEVFDLAKIYFGRIPSGPRPEPIRTKEPEQWGERRVTVSAKSQPILLIGYHVPEANHKDSRAIEALTNILGQGQSSRLYAALVKDKKVAARVLAQTGFPSDKFPNLFTVYVMPAAGKTVAECQAAIEEEIETIKKDSVTEDELTKFKRSSIKFALGQFSSHRYMAALLAYADVVLGDYGKAFDQIDEIKALKTEDIKRVANQYLVKNNRTVGEIVPEK
jgi:predicted Zn-dependent peptidase